MLTASDHAPLPSDEKGIPKSKDEVIRPMSPANAELTTYQRITEAANRPAKPRLTNVAIAGLNATNMRSGTNMMTTRMKNAVPVATGRRRSGSSPPEVIPMTKAMKVQTYPGTFLKCKMMFPNG
jgi:hypothetical protein